MPPHPDLMDFAKGDDGPAGEAYIRLLATGTPSYEKRLWHAAIRAGNGNLDDAEDYHQTGLTKIFNERNEYDYTLFPARDQWFNWASRLHANAVSDYRHKNQPGYGWNPPLLKASDVMWPQFCQHVVKVAACPDASPGKRVWGLLPQPIRVSVQTVAVKGNATEDEKKAIVAKLNGVVLVDPRFYDSDTFAPFLEGERNPTPIDGWLSRIQLHPPLLGPAEILQVNRWLLGVSFPKLIRRWKPRLALLITSIANNPIAEDADQPIAADVDQVLASMEAVQFADERLRVGALGLRLVFIERKKRREAMEQLRQSCPQHCRKYQRFYRCLVKAMKVLGAAYEAIDDKDCHLYARLMCLSEKPDPEGVVVLSHWVRHKPEILDRMDEFDPDRFELRAISWGEGSTVPTQGRRLAIVGTDLEGLLHIRILDLGGTIIVDVDETQLPSASADTISNLKQRLPGLLAPNTPTIAEQTQVFSETTSIVGLARPDLLELLEFDRDLLLGTLLKRRFHGIGATIQSMAGARRNPQELKSNQRLKAKLNAAALIFTAWLLMEIDQVLGRRALAKYESSLDPRKSKVLASVKGNRQQLAALAIAAGAGSNVDWDDLQLGLSDFLRSW